MKKSSANLSTVERSMASGGRLSQCRRLGKYLNFRDKKKMTTSRGFNLQHTFWWDTPPKVQKGENLWTFVDLINFYTVLVFLASVQSN